MADERTNCAKRIYRRTKVERTIFRKLPFGAVFFIAAIPVYGFVKSGRCHILGSLDANNRQTSLEMVDLSTAVIRVPSGDYAQTGLYAEIPPPQAPAQN